MIGSRSLIMGALLVVALPVASWAQATEKSAVDKLVVVMAKGLVFNDIDVPGFAKGMKIATLAGDPSQPAAYTIRLWFPDGYAFPPHWHPNLENITVLSGTLYLGMGETVDKAAAHKYQSGDFLVAPARMAHFGWVKGETVLQLHGTGPFEIKLVGQQ